MKRKRLSRVLAILLAAVMLLSLAACGGKDGPSENALDPENPIPADTGKVRLERTEFEDLYFALNLPDSVSVTTEEKMVTVTDQEGVWKLEFKPYTDVLTLETNINNTWYEAGKSKKSDWSQDVPGTMAGFAVRVWANNTEGYIDLSNPTETPAVDILLDYGETMVGPYYGIYIRLSTLSDEEGTNIYPILYDPVVRAILNNFEVIETSDGVMIDRGYVALNAPTKWSAHDTAMILTYREDGINHSINISPTFGADPAEVAGQFMEASDVSSYQIGDRTYYGGVSETTVGSGDEASVSRTLYLFTEFSETHSLRVACIIFGGSKEDHLNYVNDPDLVAALSSMKLTPENYNTRGGVVANGIYSALGAIFAYDGTDTEVSVPETIGDYDTYRITYAAFANNTTITKLEIPEGVTELEPHCFSGMTALETIILPSTLTTIPEYCFRGCTSLKNVVLNDEVMEVGNKAFYEAGSGSFEGSADIIYGSEAFAYSGFDSITFGEGSEVSADGLMYYSAASQVTLPESATALGAHAMEAMENLKEITLPDGITSLGDRCFAGTELTRMNLPLALESVGEDICLSESLITVDIPDELTVIPAEIFHYARIGYVNIPASVTDIGENAITADYVVLNNMESNIAENGITATALYLNGVYSTDQIKFDLSNVYVWRQVFLPMDASITESDALDAYLLSNGMEEIAWIGIAPEYYDLDMQDYTSDADDQYKLISYTGTKSSVYIPYVSASSVPIRKLAGGAFAGSSGITELSLGQVYVIEDNAFEGLSGLTDLWLNGTMAYYAVREGNLSKNSFTGLPATLTIHYPESMSAEDLAAMQAAYSQAGMPDGVTYEAYSLRQE